MRLITDSADSEYYALRVHDTGGVYLVPAFTGLGAPYWDMYARGLIIGITRGTKRAHIIRAAQESIAYQVMDLLRAMEKDLNITMKELKVDGGASRDKFLMQFQADVCHAIIIRPKITETTALGAALLAGITSGFWKDKDEVKSRVKRDIIFEPEIDDLKREKLISGWHRAVERSRGWAEGA
jgi:glycerol kinase